VLSTLQQGILARAKEIVEEKDYTLLCKRANICPICGNNLIEDRKKINERMALGFGSFGATLASNNIPTQKCTVHGFQW
jgi:hypothetical protein